MHSKGNVFAGYVNKEETVVIGSGRPEKNKGECDRWVEGIGEEDGFWGRKCGFRADR
jgi:hypothetical protein